MPWAQQCFNAVPMSPSIRRQCAICVGGVISLALMSGSNSHNVLIYMKSFSTQSLTVKGTFFGSVYFSQVELVMPNCASQDLEHIVCEHREHIPTLLWLSWLLSPSRMGFIPGVSLHLSFAIWAWHEVKGTENACWACLNQIRLNWNELNYTEVYGLSRDLYASEDLVFKQVNLDLIEIISFKSPLIIALSSNIDFTLKCIVMILFCSYYLGNIYHFPSRVSLKL